LVEWRALRILQFLGEIPTASHFPILQSANPLRIIVFWSDVSAVRRRIAQEIGMGINKDQVEGRVKEAAGKVQEVAGKTVGSTTQQVKGAANKTAGAAQAKYGDIKNDLNKNSKPNR
jgi:uncharacterized protein YjbJ (UPF0337 family)